MTERKAVRRLDEIRARAGEVPGVAVRQLKRVEEVELKLLDVDPGQATPFHAHPHAHEGVIMAGTGALRGNDGTQRSPRVTRSRWNRTSRTPSRATVLSPCASCALTASSTSPREYAAG
jgi:hypothetical protein